MNADVSGVYAAEKDVSGEKVAKVADGLRFLLLQEELYHAESRR